VQRLIMQANVWDPTKDKLPKRHNPDLPIWKFKAEWGIPVKRRMYVLSFICKVDNFILSENECDHCQGS